MYSRGEQYHGAPSGNLQYTQVQQSYAYALNTQNKFNNNRIPSQQTSQNYRPPQQQGQQFSNRFMGDEPQRQTDEFTTRKPIKTNRPVQDLAPPTAIPTRFDDINSRKISWDPELAKSTEEFSLKLFALLEALQSENLMISPYSIHTLLVMIAEGASGNTYNQLKTALGLFSPMRTRDFHQYINIALK